MVFYNVVKGTNEAKIAQLIYYHMNQTEVFVELKLENEEVLSVVLLKKRQNNRLLFGVQVQSDFAQLENFELPRVPTEKYSDLQFVYVYLQYQLGEVFNGVVVDPKPIKTEETKGMKKTDTKPKKV